MIYINSHRVVPPMARNLQQFNLIEVNSRFSSSFI